MVRGRVATASLARAVETEKRGHASTWAPLVCHRMCAPPSGDVSWRYLEQLEQSPPEQSPPEQPPQPPEVALVEEPPPRWSVL